MTTDPLPEPTPLLAASWSAVLAHVFVPGRPRTKGSLRATCTKNRVHTIRYEESVTESKPWRAKMARALREDQLARHGHLVQFPDAVEVWLTFWYDREEIASHATPYPTSILLGDVDKASRNALDAMLTPNRREGMELCSALLADDSQVVDLNVRKRWSDRRHPAGALIRVLVAPDGPDA